MKDNRYFIFCILDFFSIIFCLFLIFTNNFYNIFDGLIILLMLVLMLWSDLKHYENSIYKDRKGGK